MGSWTLAGATVVDGTGSVGRTADVVIEDDRIAAIGSGERRGTVIDAGGLVAVPGFVDIHSHVDWIAPSPPARRCSRRTCAGHHDVAGRQLRISPAPLGSSFNRGAIEQMLLVAR
jgi:N-acyl-D-amino-acid deacylase